MTRLILLCVLLLTGCGHNSLPEPSGPLRAMNPGQWVYSGNNVLAGTRTGPHD